VSRSTETWALRDALRDALSSRVPRTGPELFRIVTDDWGHFDERRLWRGLGWLLQRGIAVQIGRRHATCVDDIRGYVRGTGLEYPSDAKARARNELIEQGACPRCCKPVETNRPMWMGRTTLCMRCYWIVRQPGAAYKRERYLELKAEHICTCCKRRPAHKGKINCARCARIQRDCTVKRRLSFKGAGICICGGYEARPGKTDCEACARAKQEHYRRQAA
jgi:hypothetical protein